MLRLVFPRGSKEGENKMEAKKTRAKLLGLGLVAILLLVACAGSPTTAPIPTQGAPTTAPLPTTAPAPTQGPPTTAALPTAAATKAPVAVATAVPTAVAEVTKPKGAITIALTGEPGSIDPTTQVGQDPWKGWIRNVAEPLVDRVKNSPDLKPRLAEKWERTAPTVWRFYLRKGAKFTSGNPVTAAAVVWSVKREIDPSVKSTSKTYLASIQDAKAIDDYTVDIITKDPDPIVPTRMWFAPVVEPGDISTLAVKPVSAAPYKVVEWVKGQYLKITANEDYWGGAPKIKDVTFVFRTESRVRAAMVKTGEADLAYMLSPEDVSVVPKAVKVQSLEIAFLRFNTRNPVLKDVRVRQALVYAIDYDSVITKLYGGYAVPAYGAQVVTKLVTGFNPTVNAYPYDLAKAKQLIKDAGAQGAKLTMFSRTGFYPRVEELGEFLVESWRAIGLDVNVQFLDAAGWADKIYAVKPEQNPADIALGKHENDTYDSSKSAESYLTCDGNISTVCDEVMDSLVRQAGAAEGDKRAQLYSQAWSRAQEVVPWGGIANFVIVYAWSDKLQWDTPPFDTKIDLREMSVK